MHILKQMTGYLAPIGLEEYLKKELKNITHEYGRLILAEGPPQVAYWAQNIWLDPQEIDFQSISDAAKKLRELQRLWSFYPYNNIRKGTLISEKLPYFSPKPLIFPNIPPTSSLGSWTVLDDKTLLASPSCSSSFAQGEVHFQESKIPPSRAYLKLWEALTRMGCMPKPGDTCLEVGASPGSWTWVLQQLGANVIAIDRAKLDESISSLPNVQFMKKDAFSLGPKDFPKLDWIFSDVICYPEKLLIWIKQWLDIDAKVNFVCTLKFQGEVGLEVIKEFEKIEGSYILHLFHNKHELTWFLKR
ncbi:MAG: SAM-dependent methyltransferase [Chlamydiota bacterium]